jgi:hypothetical protein
MKVVSLLAVAASLFCALAGCDRTPTEKKSNAEEKIQAALAKLSDEDRKLAVAQKFCAVEPKKRLGSMDVPIKVTLNGQPVFLCCKGCKDDAEKTPEETVKKANELKAANK